MSARWPVRRGGRGAVGESSYHHLKRTSPTCSARRRRSLVRPPGSHPRWTRRGLVRQNATFVCSVSSVSRRALQLATIATLDRRHFTVVRPTHTDVFTLP